MSNYSYVAVDPRGLEMRGVLEVSDQNEALRRIKEMGLYPTKVLQERRERSGGRKQSSVKRGRRLAARSAIRFSLGGKVKPAILSVFTRQLATLVEAGMPLVRGFRILQEQETNPRMKEVIGELLFQVEGGIAFAEAVGAQPKVFNKLYVNMVKAGEIGGALEVTLARLSEFLEKAQRIKGKIVGAMFYPCAVLTVAMAILAVLLVYVVPQFKAVFEGLGTGQTLPAFTRFVFDLSDSARQHAPLFAVAAVAAAVLFRLALRTKPGRWSFDLFKLTFPGVGPVFKKAAIARFARTLGTLVSNGVPILQALTIVKETAGNVVVADVIGRVHENVKEGEPIAPTLKASRVFPVMVAGMVDVGEQTGALPELLLKVADNYDQEVDTAVGAMTSLIEPVMIVLLAVIVGSIVIAVFLPIITYCPVDGNGARGDS
jgi:type IV pilus assembly protein PilC